MYNSTRPTEIEKIQTTRALPQWETVHGIEHHNEMKI
jgi:hypothetical protein